MVYRIFVEKKPALAQEAGALLSDLRTLFQITSLTGLRIVNRYDVENIDAALFDACKTTVFSEPQLDTVSDTLHTKDAHVFAVEYLPGQFDQRADSAAQCIQIISQGERPTVRTAKVYLLYGPVTESELAQIKKYVINPVEAREASLDPVETLKTNYTIPTTVDTVSGFCTFSPTDLSAFLNSKGLAMDMDDLQFCQEYFRNEQRDPTITEIKMITLNAGVMDAVFPQYDMMAVTIATGRNSLKFAAVFSDAARLLRSRIIFRKPMALYRR